MSKLSFRARALDAAKPLSVYRNGDIPDVTDCVSISRAVLQMPTGMEKEEETVWKPFISAFQRASGVEWPTAIHYPFTQMT